MCVAGGDARKALHHLPPHGWGWACKEGSATPFGDSSQPTTMSTIPSQRTLALAQLKKKNWRRRRSKPEAGERNPERRGVDELCDWWMMSVDVVNERPSVSYYRMNVLMTTVGCHWSGWTSVSHGFIYIAECLVGRKFLQYTIKGAFPFI